VILLVLAGAGLLSMRLLLGRAEVELPQVDLDSMEPQVAEKIETFAAAVRESPHSSEAWGALGTVYQAHSLHAAAAKAYEKAIALDPSEFRWQYLLVHAYRGVDVKKALAQAERASSVSGDYAPLFVVEAELVEELGEPERALELYDRAISLDPENTMAAFGLGRLHLAQGDAQQALEWLVRAERLESEAGAIHASLARAYRRLGDQEKARQEARLASEKQEPVRIADPIHFEMRQESVASTTLLTRAMEAYKAGDYPSAEAIYVSLVKLRPDDPDIRARFGDTLAQQNKRSEAKAQYLAALEIRPNHAAAHYGLANMLNFEGDYDGAERHYREALSLRPRHVPTLLNLGSLLVFRERTDEAEALFRRGLEIDPKDFGCRRQLGLLLVRSGRPDEAIEHLETAVSMRPREGALRGSLALALAKAGRLEEARTHAREAERLGAHLPPQFLQALERSTHRP
jgi:tetratricopeptide (TPR) repeat protein